ncbi:hypothetical protein PFISCL1PPCAC_10315, partial [Pristionchus fissidentatus]
LKRVMGEAWELKPMGEDESFHEEKLISFTEESRWVKWVRWAVYAVLIIGAHVYLGFSIAYSFQGALFPVVMFSLIYLYIACWLINRFIVQPMYRNNEEAFDNFGRSLVRVFTWSLFWGISVLPTVIAILVLGGFFGWIIYDASGNEARLRSMGGIIMYVILCVLMSANPHRIKWRPVIGGVVQQFVIGLIVLKWDDGREALSWASDQVVTFLDYTMVGTAFTYGFVSEPPNICGFGSIFLYTSLQIIIYFGSIVAVLYYLGVIEAVLKVVAIGMQYTLGTTAAESLNAAACIFLGQTEAAILIQPALETMTASEVHAVMTAGFACIAGSLFSAYISFGACPSYLLSASVMSAGASLGVAKLLYPEIQVSSQKRIQDFKFAKMEETNILECISNGAVHSAKFVFEIGANLIVYLALLACLNSSIGYLGGLVGYPELTFNEILGYCFFPLAYMMGASDAPDSATNIDETLKVAQLMGMKTVLNEFIAYQSLADMIRAGTLTGARAQMIATYALCGFSNISMIGSQLGILGGMCPKRKAVFAKVVVRALIAGSITCFMTACTAGVLVDIPMSCDPTSNDNCLNLDDVVSFWKNRQNFTSLF